MVNIYIGLHKINTCILSSVCEWKHVVLQYCKSVSLTFPQSNIPIDVGYNVFYSQVLRYGNACSSLDNFLIPLRKTFRLLLNRGYNYKKLIICIKKCFQKYDDVFRKYSIKDKKIIILNV